MSVVSKVYREPKEALKAIENLTAAGIHANSIGVVVKDNAVGEMIRIKHKEYPAGKANLGAAGAVLLLGALAAAKPSNGVESELAKAVGVNEDKFAYYVNDLELGGVVVSANAGDADTPKAEKALRDAESVVKFQVTSAKGAGFMKASRMVSTNPIDAPMSGDFRKY